MYEKSLEDRVVALEAKNERLTQDLRMTLALMSASSPNAFGSPLERFFDGPDTLFPTDPLKEFKCITDCAKTFGAMIKAANGNQDQIDAAVNELVECQRKCMGFPG